MENYAEIMRKADRVSSPLALVEFADYFFPGTGWLASYCRYQVLVARRETYRVICVFVSGWHDCFLFDENDR